MKLSMRAVDYRGLSESVISFGNLVQLFRSVVSFGNLGQLFRSVISFGNFKDENIKTLIDSVRSDANQRVYGVDLFLYLGLRCIVL